MIIAMLLFYKRVKGCYTDIRSNVIYGTKTEKKQKMGVLGDNVGSFCGGWGDSIFGVG